jgi:hypothetical protein
MSDSELNNLPEFLNSEKERYAVYFSNGDKLEVVATSEEEAKTAARAMYFDRVGYCTRAVRLN